MDDGVLMWRIAIIALVGGCLRANAAFHCASNADCTNGGAAGRCEADGLCSFADATCASGQRYGTASGDVANTCVTGGADAGVDSQHDAHVADPPVFVDQFHTTAPGDATMTYTIDISSADYLLVLVQLPTTCTGPTPTVTAVTYAGAPMTFITSLTGTPCNPSPDGSHSEHWGLKAPAAGMHDVVVQLSGTAPALMHSFALWFTGVNQATPVRTTAAMSGHGIISTLDVATQPNDLVVNTTGDGGSISTSNQTNAFIQNVSGTNTLNNSGAATVVATDTTTTMSWTYGSVDEWHTISTVLQP